VAERQAILQKKYDRVLEEKRNELTRLSLKKTKMEEQHQVDQQWFAALTAILRGAGENSKNRDHRHLDFHLERMKDIIPLSDELAQLELATRIDLLEATIQQYEKAQAKSQKLKVKT
jgi:hypothetical protein